MRTKHANKKLIRNKFKFNLYVQVRFELNYMSEISYLTVHIYEKTRKDASFDMTLKQEIKKVMLGHKKDAHLNNK